MRKCTGYSCPMQKGFNVNKCEIGNLCPSFQDLENYLQSWAMTYFILCKEAGLSREEMINFIPGEGNYHYK